MVHDVARGVIRKHCRAAWVKTDRAAGKHSACGHVSGLRMRGCACVRVCARVYSWEATTGRSRCPGTGWPWIEQRPRLHRSCLKGARKSESLRHVRAQAESDSAPNTQVSRATSADNMRCATYNAPSAAARVCSIGAVMSVSSETGRLLEQSQTVPVRLRYRCGAMLVRCGAVPMRCQRGARMLRAVRRPGKRRLRASARLARPSAVQAVYAQRGVPWAFVLFALRPAYDWHPGVCRSRRAQRVSPARLGQGAKRRLDQDLPVAAERALPPCSICVVEWRWEPRRARLGLCSSCAWCTRFAQALGARSELRVPFESMVASTADIARVRGSR